MRRMKRGFALIAVLWTVVCAAALVAGLLLATRASLGAIRNRTTLEEAFWIADGCIEVARAEITAALSGYRAGSLGPRPWELARNAISESYLVISCGGEVTLSATGMAVNVNAASESQLRRLIQTQEQDTLRVDSLVDALLDWRDADDVPRNRGAENDWYAEAKRMMPRNGPFASDNELKLVRGFEATDSLTPLLTVEEGRIVAGLAPLPVIASLPGSSVELVLNLARKRESGEVITDLADLGSALSRDGQATFEAGFRDLTRLATIEPESWLLTARAASAPQNPSATIELRLVVAGPRLVTMRRRQWP